jgi:hypothetical protein
MGVTGIISVQPRLLWSGSDDFVESGAELLWGLAF